MLSPDRPDAPAGAHPMPATPVMPDAPAAPPAAPVMSPRRVALIGGLFVAIGPISMALYTPAMTELVRAFGTTEAAVKLTLGLYFAGFAVAQLVAGPLSDALGRRPVTLGFMVLYLAGSLLAMVATDIDTLLTARLVQGVGASAGVAIARAIVRDLYTGETSARIMNVIGIILSIGPALAPTLGGLALTHLGWRALFVLMAAFGAAIMAVTAVSLRETVPERVPLDARALALSYRTLAGSGRFLSSALVLGGALGALYAQATFLPFILMGRVGLSPEAFGLGMIAQSGSFLAGSLAARALMPRLGAARLVAPGLALIAVGSVLVAWLAATPTFLSVMGPLGLYAAGIAFVMPAMSTAALAPFPRIAGAAAALLGFVQMGAGLAGSVIGAALGDPVLALTRVIPAMGALAVVSFLWWRALERRAAVSTGPAGAAVSP